MATLTTGMTLERYTISHVLGEGGFGVTYLAEDKELGKKFAIKEYFPQSWSSRDETDSMSVRINSAATQDYSWGLDRFKEEARTLAKFRHPNIVNVNSILDANNTAYMVLDYEDGDNFDTWLKGLGRAPTQAELDTIIEPILDALELIHSNKILHRDIAPDNIYIREDGSPVLLDFGSARDAIGHRTKTVSAIIKMGYSPIEQYSTAGKDQGPWTDIYSLGATMYRAIAGKRIPEATERALKDDYVPASEAAQDEYRSGFLHGIDLALERHFTDRPQNIADWRKVLMSNDDFSSQQTRVAPINLSTSGAATRAASPSSDPDGLPGSSLPGQPAGVSANLSSGAMKWVAGLAVLAGLAAGGYFFTTRGENPDTTTLIDRQGGERDLQETGQPESDAERARRAGIDHYRAGRYDQAIKEYTLAVRLDPKNDRAFGNRGLAYATKGDNENAIKDYNRSLSINPKNVATLDNRAAVYIKQGKLKEAIGDYNDALLYRPGDAQLLNNRGYALLLNYEYERALRDFDRAIAANPNLHTAYANRAIIHERQSRINEAIADHRKALEVKPGYDPSVKALARLKPSGQTPPTSQTSKADRDRAVKAYNEANDLRDKGDLNGAVRSFTRAIEFDPRYVEAYNNRGNAYTRLRQYDKAISDFNQALSIDPKYYRAYYNRANAHKAKGDRDQAIKDYGEAIRLNPDYTIAYNNRGNTYNDLGQTDRAIQDFNDAIRTDSKYYRAYYNRAIAHKKKGDVSRALQDYNEAIRLNPKYTLAYNNRGNIYKDRGDLNRAIDDYTSALKYNSRYALAYYNRGQAYEDKGDRNRAISDYQSALRYDPDYKRAQDALKRLNSGGGTLPPSTGQVSSANKERARKAYNQANDLRDKGDLNGAVRTFTQALQYNPRYVEAYNNRGNAYTRLRQYDKAISDFDQALSIDPKYYRAYYNRANAYKAKGNREQAIKDYGEAIRYKSDYTIAYNNRGNTYNDLGQTDQAIQDFNQALRYDPKYYRAYYNRAIAYKKKGDVNRALQDYNEAIRLNPKYTLAYNNRGNIYKDRGDLNRAIADYSSALKYNPRYTLAYSNRGNAYEDKGDRNRAIADYRSALRYNPGYQRAKDGLKRLGARP